MGFFSDLKEDLAQAVNELMPEEEQIRAGEEQTGGAQTDEPQISESELSIDEMLKNIEDIELPEEQTGWQEPEAEEQADLQSPEAEEKETTAESQRNEIKDTEGGMEMDTVREVADETAVITAGMVITGDISTEGSIDVIGTINGNVDALGKLNITGRIVGNSKAAEIYAESAKINGEIVSEGAVKVGASAVIIGNISATSAAIAGAVKGDIDVKGPVILDASAIVMGNIKSKSVQINNGAVIEGMCSQCYADVSPTSFFDEYKPEIRKAKVK